MIRGSCGPNRTGVRLVTCHQQNKQKKSCQLLFSGSSTSLSSTLHCDTRLHKDGTVTFFFFFHQSSVVILVTWYPPFFFFFFFFFFYSNIEKKGTVNFFFFFPPFFGVKPTNLCPPFFFFFFAISLTHPLCLMSWRLGSLQLLFLRGGCDACSAAGRTHTL